MIMNQFNSELNKTKLILIMNGYPNNQFAAQFIALLSNSNRLTIN